jgi:hypothetical protein
MRGVGASGGGCDSSPVECFLFSFSWLFMVGLEGVHASEGLRKGRHSWLFPFLFSHLIGFWLCVPCRSML